MKFYLLALTCLVPLMGRAQKSITASGDPYVFSSVIKCDSSLKKDQLYATGLQWFTKAFNSSKSVIQDKDKDAGFIIGKGNFVAQMNTNKSHTYRVDFTIRLSFKDGKIKYELFDFDSELGTVKDGKITQYPFFIGHGMVDGVWSDLKQNCIERNDSIRESLTAYFNNSSNSNNW